ncbi:ANTAR domain-containing response regulator [Lachnobacterium bovis]|uniref:Response regulator NasT n=1 Tax=Lachnobacterium bovis TaxID=140626 RepID=A0A1H9S1J7_9FIRM|nr:ANTAR domain-containing protein [Lachnobacterium bovis]SER77999.1 response regulator NasT [Lachnobacterium bovis]
MNNIIVAFPNEKNAQKIKRILTQSGYSVKNVCTTGAAVLASMGNLESGILVCGSQFVDMRYTEIFEYMSQDFQMLLVASPQAVDDRFIVSDKNQRLVCLYLPIKVHELLETIEMMNYSINRKKKKRKKLKERTPEEKKQIEDAKLILMNRNNMTEEEAHRYIQKRSMDNGISFLETAQMILSLLG